MPAPHLRRAAPGLRAPHARTTARLDRAHESIGWPSAARPDPTGGAHGHDDQPRHAAPARQAAQGRLGAPPRFVGIDDWAWCKGQRYGTIVVDLEPGDVIDLLPDRDAETVKNVARGPSRRRAGQPRPLVDLRPGGRRGGAEAPAGRRSMAPVEERARGDRAALRAPVCRHRRGPQTSRAPTHPAFSPMPAETAAAPPDTEPSRLCRRANPAQGTSSPEGSHPLNRLHPSRRTIRLRDRQGRRSGRRGDGGAAGGSKRFTSGTVRADQSGGSPGNWGYPARPCGATSGGNLPRLGAGSDARPGGCPPRRDRRSAGRGFDERRGTASAVDRAWFRGSYGSVWRYVSKRLGPAGKRAEARRGLRLRFPRYHRPSNCRSSGYVGPRSVSRPSRHDSMRSAPERRVDRRVELADEFAELIRKRSQGTLSDWLTRGEAS